MPINFSERTAASRAGGGMPAGMARCAVPVAGRSVRRRNEPGPAYASSGSFRPPSRSGTARPAGFSLVEIMLVTVLLSLIMLALMAVFNAAQTAFRASVTQTDVLEGGRATMDILGNDFRQMAPSGSIYTTNLTTDTSLANINYGYPIPSPVNFWLGSPTPTVNQTLVGVSNNQQRTNQVQDFFILTYENQVWKGVGYHVDTLSTNYIYPLYRYDSSPTNVLPVRPTPMQIFTNFYSNLYGPISETNAYMHHLLDGVVHLNVRAYDTNGLWLTNAYVQGQQIVENAFIGQTNGLYSYPTNGEYTIIMCSNTLPVAVEIQMGVLEDRALSRAMSFGMSPSSNYSNYLAQQVGRVHLFRERVSIPNVDSTTYQ